MNIEDSIVLALFALAFPVTFLLIRRKQKQHIKIIETTIETGTNITTNIESNLSQEFQKKIIIADRLRLISIAAISTTIVISAYALQLEKRHAITALTILISSTAFINLKKLFQKKQEEAKNVSLLLCSQWLTLRHSKGENKIKLQSIDSVSFSTSPHPNLTITFKDGQTQQLIGFNNTEKIFIAIHKSIEDHKNSPTNNTMQTKKT